jgi:glycosyltransferase involved in cell wall biosynthesis
MPLVFYMKRFPRKAAIIFSNMDSWFVDVHRDMRKLWYRKYYSFNYALENADLVDFLSPFILEGIRERNIKLEEDNVVVAPCSFTDYTKCTIGKKNDFEISYASRLEPDKNPILFLEAVKKIHSEYPHVKFHLLGEGSLVYEIENFIAGSRLGDTVDFRFHPNPPEIFAKTSVFITLQSNTNYPSQSVLEAMACGNAVIAGNTGDTNLLINESNGLLINLNIDELAGAMKKLIDSPELAVSMGNAGRDFVLKYHTIEKMADYYIDLIEKVNQKVFPSG